MGKGVVIVKISFCQPSDKSRKSNYWHIQHIAGGQDTGLFGPDDEAAPDLREVGEELSRHDLPVWRIIVSMRESDAQKLGIIARADWENAICNGTQNAIYRLSLNPDRARWVAAYHAKQGHPYAHVVIWETPHAGTRRRWLLERGEIKSVWRAFGKELLANRRFNLKLERWANEAEDLLPGDGGGPFV